MIFGPLDRPGHRNGPDKERYWACRGFWGARGEAPALLEGAWNFQVTTCIRAFRRTYSPPNWPSYMSAYAPNYHPSAPGMLQSRSRTYFGRLGVSGLVAVLSHEPLGKRRTLRFAKRWSCKAVQFRGVFQTPTLLGCC